MKPWLAIGVLLVSSPAPAQRYAEEPTQGLSAEDTAATVAVIRRLARERRLTIVLVEHDMDVVFDLAERISVLNFGRLIADGPPEKIRMDPAVQKAYLGGTE